MEEEEIKKGEPTCKRIRRERKTESVCGENGKGKKSEENQNRHRPDHHRMQADLRNSL